MKPWICGLLLVTASAVASHAAEKGVPGHGWLPPLPAGQEWKLVWSDEFDGPQVDTNKWELLGDWKRRDGWWVKEDSFLDGKGNLVLRTKKEGERFTSGAVRTRGRFEHAFGYWTARCQLPKAPGHWAAFWLMSDRVGQVGDEGRDGTEIDIAEFPWRDGKFTMNLHWDGYGQAHKRAGTNVFVPAITDGFHEFSLAWHTNEYVFYLDGRETWRTSAGGVARQPEFAKFSNEVGEWAGDIRKAKLPDDFLIDYIRVYDAVPAGGKTGGK